MRISKGDTSTQTVETTKEWECLLRQILPVLWNRHTSRNYWNEDQWSIMHPSTGQCAVTALLVQSLCGGVICRVEFEGQGHYFGIIDGEIVDLTTGQFDSLPDYTEGKLIERNQILSNQSTMRRYSLLRSQFDQLVKRIRNS
jgi:hypothetical protein